MRLCGSEGLWEMTSGKLRFGRRRRGCFVSGNGSVPAGQESVLAGVSTAAAKRDREETLEVVGETAPAAPAGALAVTEASTKRGRYQGRTPGGTEPRRTSSGRTRTAGLLKEGTYPPVQGSSRWRTERPGYLGDAWVNPGHQLERAAGRRGSARQGIIGSGAGRRSRATDVRGGRARGCAR